MKMKQDNKNPVKQLAFAGILSAFTLLLTYILPISIPNMSGAYINLGDIGVYISGMLLGFPYGVLAAAVGSALADLLLGSFIYILPTFIIKGLMAYVVYALLKRYNKKYLFALLCAGSIMPIGYFIYEAMLYGPQTASLGIPMNLIQYAVGALLGALSLGIIAKYRDGKF